MEWTIQKYGHFKAVDISFNRLVNCSAKRIKLEALGYQSNPIDGNCRL